MGIGEFLKKLGFGSKPKAAPLVIGSQNGHVPDHVLNAVPQADFVPAPLLDPVEEPTDNSGKPESAPVIQVLPPVSLNPEIALTKPHWGNASNAFLEPDPALMLTDAEIAKLLPTGPKGTANLKLIRWHDEIWFSLGDTGKFLHHDNRRLLSRDIFASDARGISYRTENARIGNFTPGNRAKLMREPGNEFDANAVAIVASNGRTRTGYIKASKAKHLAKLLDAGDTLEVLVLRGEPRGEYSGGPVTVLAASSEMMTHLTRELG